MVECRNLRRRLSSESHSALFEKIRASKPKPATPKPAESTPSPQAMELENQPESGDKGKVLKPVDPKPKPKPPPKPSTSGAVEAETWPQKHRPKSTSEIIANQSIVKQLKDWLAGWEKNNLSPRSANNKKAALLSGAPGIGKTTTARLLCEELGYEAIEVNASDSRGKADSKIQRGVGGSTSNAVKELVSNTSLSGSGQKKSVLIMDEVDGMSAGDRGGVADLIASTKLSKIPIICICNDRYSQKLKSLINHCLQLSYRKPTKQQMSKRLQEIARAEKLTIDAIALEELSERTHGDMRLALNQLQYMSLNTNVLKYSDIKAYSSASGKDEEISPFSAVDKLLGFDGGRLKFDDRIDLAMSDMDLVPLIIQENYLDFKPASCGSSEISRMDHVARAATSIADGDIINVQIRRYRQWQLARSAAFMSSILPAALMHGRRDQEGGNFNRFAGWLGKNSTFGKKARLLGDVHVHVLASGVGDPTRKDLRLDYLSVLKAQLSQPLRTMEKAEGVQTVLAVMEKYSLTQEDVATILDITKLEGHPDPLEGVPPPVKAALTKGFAQALQTRRVKTADLLPNIFLGQKEVSKKKARLITPEDIEGEELPKDNDEEEKEEEDEQTEEQSDDAEKNLEALKSLKASYEITVAGETKGKGDKRTTILKTKQKPAPSKGASSSKGTKRKR